MNESLKKEAIEAFKELYAVTGKYFNNNYSIPSEAVNYLSDLIKSDDEEKIKNYILLTKKYTASLRID